MNGQPAHVVGRPIWLKLLIGLAFAFAAFNIGIYVYGLTLPGEWHVEESIVIDAPPDAIYTFLSSPKRWTEWSGWSRRSDPTAELAFEGSVEGKDASMVWQGERLGAGRMTITAAEPGRSVTYSLRLGGSEFSDAGRLSLKPADGGTRVTWTDGGELGGTPGRLFGRRLEASVSADFSASLVRLKELVEREPSSAPEKAT